PLIAIALKVLAFIEASTFSLSASQKSSASSSPTRRGVRTSAQAITSPSPLCPLTANINTNNIRH
ncbi:hypothetical protein, partial [Sutterella wadsworthensis]|uniref:hypothetical protein n=1 Tax=Sutterella wadsworthensis TaxID=40545 RepID=UPI00242C784F